jgi:hypothetical protein
VRDGTFFFSLDRWSRLEPERSSPVIALSRAGPVLDKLWSRHGDSPARLKIDVVNNDLHGAHKVGKRLVYRPKTA